MIHIMSNDSSSSLGSTTISDNQIQPNAIDLRVDKIFKVNAGSFYISDDKKVHRGSTELEPNKDGYFELTAGTYEIIMEGIVSIGEGEAGWVITRSTLNRNGIFITSGLYDSGYEGVMAGALHVMPVDSDSDNLDFESKAFIQKGTRVGQFLLFKAESLSMYDGDYGVGKSHDKKYEV